jgi:hypothetical protein
MGLLNEKKPEVENLVTLSLKAINLSNALLRGAHRTATFCWNRSRYFVCDSGTCHVNFYEIPVFRQATILHGKNLKEKFETTRSFLYLLLSLKT